MQRPARTAGVAIAALTLVVGGCVEPKPSSPTGADLAKIDLSPDHTITVDEDGFHPQKITVRSGEVLLLVNRGTRLHSFTAEERFDTGRLHPGDDTTVVLTEPGRIPYEDLETPGHTGTITVSKAPHEG